MLGSVLQGLRNWAVRRRRVNIQIEACRVVAACESVAIEIETGVVLGWARDAYSQFFEELESFAKSGKVVFVKAPIRNAVTKRVCDIKECPSHRSSEQIIIKR